MSNFFGKSWAKAKEWWGPAKGAIMNHINISEAIRIFVAAIVAGGSTSQFIHLFYDHVPNIAKDETTASVLSGIIVLLAETLRRLGHEDPERAVFAPHLDLGKIDEHKIK